MLAAGIGIPVLAALNAQLGLRLGSPAMAAAIAFAVGGGCALAVAALAGGLAPAGLLSQPPALYFAGVFAAFYILSITWVAPTFGVGNAVFFVLLGQLVSAAIIDHFGLIGARPAPVGPLRAGGILLMAAGVLLTQKA
jgi:transporter family-2 protein